MAGLIHTDTLEVLRRALDGLSLRQQVIANNLANVDTPGFKAGEVLFEDALRQAIGRSPLRELPLAVSDPRHLRASSDEAVAPRVATLNGAARADGNTVDPDREMARLAETQISYAAAAGLVQTRLALLRAVISGR